jgi:uncharacterized protein YbcI
MIFMAEERTIQDEVGEYVSKVLEEHLGESPESVNVIIKRPYIVVHLSGFMLASERFLLKRSQRKRVAETRDVLMTGLRKNIITDLAKMTGFTVAEFYADWNLEKETGLLMAVIDERKEAHTDEWPKQVEKKELLEKIVLASKKAQKEPGQIDLSWLTDSMLLVERKEIMVEIEKELIKNGVTEELRLAKRTLEHRMINSVDFEPVLKRPIKELFLDWDFEGDKAILVLILETDAG